MTDIDTYTKLLFFKKNIQIKLLSESQKKSKINNNKNYLKYIILFPSKTRNLRIQLTFDIEPKKPLFYWIVSEIKTSVFFPRRREENYKI